MTKFGFKVIGWRYRDTDPRAAAIGPGPWTVAWQATKPEIAWTHHEVEPIFQPSEIVEARALALAICPELAQIKMNMQYRGVCSLLGRLSHYVTDSQDRDSLKRALDDIVKMFPGDYEVVKTSRNGYSLEPKL